MKTMNITISNVKNANELDSFTPVEGEWSLDADSENRSEDGIIESVKNWMDADYEINVQLFATNGHAITGDMPSRGTFLATRQ